MMGRFATGVTVVGARHGPLLAGMSGSKWARYFTVDEVSAIVPWVRP